MIVKVACCENWKLGFYSFHLYDKCKRGKIPLVTREGEKKQKKKTGHNRVRMKGGPTKRALNGPRWYRRGEWLNGGKGLAGKPGGGVA